MPIDAKTEARGMILFKKYRVGDKKSKGQSILEYLVLSGVVGVAAVSMFTGLKRSIQSIVKVTADQVGNQLAADQDPERNLGYLKNSWSLTTLDSNKRRQDFFGETTFTFDDTVKTDSVSIVNLGFQERNN
jgi:hypothetical protein